MVGPLMGSVVAKTIAIGEVVPNLEFKDIRYVRRALSDLGKHQGLALVFLNTDCPVSKRFLPKLREFLRSTARKIFSSWAFFVRPKIPSWKSLLLPSKTTYDSRW